MKKKQFIHLTVAVVLVTALFVGIWMYQNMVPNHDTKDYNTYATAQAYASGLIGQNDVLIIKSLKREFGGNSTAEFVIYRLPEGGSGAQYLDKTAAKVGADLEEIGTATCLFIDDDPTQIKNLKTIYTR